MIKKIKDYLKHSIIFEPIYYLIKKSQLNKWKANGKPPPMPNIAKIEILKKYADKYNIKNFVETGTFMGDTTWALRKKFKKIFTIEIDKRLYENAKNKFNKLPYVKVIYGDSGEKIKDALREIEGRCLFWLDGHYSAGMTSKGNLDSPIKKELQEIFKHNTKNDILLIDDLRYFNGKNGYPTLNELKSILTNSNLKYQFKIEDDIIVILFNEK